jgi:DNA repair protein RadC
MYEIPVVTVSVVRERILPVEGKQWDPIKNVDDITKVIRGELLDKDREHLICLNLSARHFVIGLHTVSIGTLTASLAHPREIFKAAIIQGAAGIIIAHNHPSGDPSPSEEDVRLTKRVSQAGQILGIPLLDHVVVGTEGTYSFKTAGHL